METFEIEVRGTIIVQAETKSEAIELAEKDLTDVMFQWDIEGVN